MTTFASYASLPTPPRRARSQVRRHVVPVWWMTLDEDSHSTNGLDEQPDDESAIRDETPQKMIPRLRPVQFEASDQPVLADKTERYLAKFANRLRRQPAVISLSKQYLESDECSTRQSHEAAPVQRQTIHAAVATQFIQDGANYRTSRHSFLSPDTNQPVKIKISSASRGASAQTEATKSEAWLCENKVDSAGQQDGHKTNYIIGSGTEDTCSRSSIASEETASIRGFGDARATIRLVQHSETPKPLPQRAEFLNASSSSGRYESLLPRRRDPTSAQNHTEERSKPSRIQSSIAGFKKFPAPANEKRQKRRPAAMRVETSPRRGWTGNDDDLVKLAASRHWGDQSNPKSWLLDADNMLSQRSLASAHIPQPGRGANGRLPPVPGISEDRQPRSDIVLGQARAIKMSKPGEARLVKLSAKKSRPFNIDCLSSEEADLMASMGAVARSSRRSSAWADDERSNEGGSPDIDAVAETVFPKRGLQPSRIPRAIPRAKEGGARSSEQAVQEESRGGQDDGRFHQLVRQLETSHPDYTLPRGIPADTKPNRRDSGCPSLMSDDGRDSTASPGDMAYEYARAQIFQGPHRLDGWETDDAATTVAPHEAPSKSSFGLFNISTDENELVSEVDTNDHTDETSSDGSRYGRWCREPQAVASAICFHHGNIASHLQEGVTGDKTTGRHACERTLYSKCAILRWMHSTTDAPDTAGMHDESGRWWELLNLKDSYQLRYGDETRSEILRALHLLSGAEEAQPEASQEVQASLRRIVPRVQETMP